MDCVARRARVRDGGRAGRRLHARSAEHPVHPGWQTHRGHRMNARYFTRGELDALAVSPADQFAASVAAGDADATLAVFDRLERSYRNFVDGFDALAAAIHEWTSTTHGFDALT